MARTAHHRPIDQTTIVAELIRERTELVLDHLAVDLVERRAANVQRGDVIVAHESIDLPVTDLRHAADGRVAIAYDGVSGAGERYLDAGQLVRVRPFTPQLSPAH